MKEHPYIKYHKWTKKDSKKLFQSISKILNISHQQFYMPLMSLFFYIHNTPKSHKIMDLSRKYYLREIKSIIKERYYNSNVILRGDLYDSGKNIIQEKEIFCKTIPILDPIQCINNNYNLICKNNYHLPSGYNYNTFYKINDMNNYAYIDVFCSYLFSQLVIDKKIPSFAIFYGSLNGIGDYKYDISEEYDDLRIDKCFNYTLGKGFDINMYISDSEEETESELESGSECENELESENGSESEDSNHNDDYIALIRNTPLQLLFVEKLDNTLEDFLLDEDFNHEVLLSCLFQISFSLTYLQKHYQFTHNDLHINNIMYSKTESHYLYYKLNNMYFKIPTYGKIFKIIDFGRSIFTFRNKTYMNDVFSKHGEAGGQYYYPKQVNFNNNNNHQKIEANYHFDLCRLSMTILDELDTNKINNKINNDLFKLLNSLCSDKDGNNFRDMDDDFNLYISIARYANNSLPKETLKNKLFKRYRVPKKKFPRKSYYQLN